MKRVMNLIQFILCDETCWEIPESGKMRVPAIIYADLPLLRAMNEKSLSANYQCRLLTGYYRSSLCKAPHHKLYFVIIGSYLLILDKHNS